MLRPDVVIRVEPDDMDHVAFTVSENTFASPITDHDLAQILHLLEMMAQLLIRLPVLRFEFIHPIIADVVVFPRLLQGLLLQMGEAFQYALMLFGRGFMQAVIVKIHLIESETQLFVVE